MIRARPPVEIGTPTFKITKAQDRARDVLISDAVHVALGGGSRSGKTFLLVRQTIVRAIKAPGSRHAIFRFRFNALKASVIYDTLPKVLDMCFPGLPKLSSMLNKTDWFMTLPNRSEIWFGGLDDKERTEKVLGQEYATLYFNECSQIPWASIVLAMSRLAQRTEELKLKAYYDFNPPSKLHWTYLQFVEKRNPEDKVPYEHPEKYGFYLINPADNRENLAPEYLSILESMPEKQRNRFLLGLFADDSEGALWTVEMLAQGRVLGQSGSLPEFLRVIVAVDPSGASGPDDTRSDEIGIMVGGLGTDGHGYLLEDLTVKAAPEVWGRVAAEAYKRHKADKIVGEANYGGDMVRATIHAQDPLVPFGLVNATRGKVVRADPISSLYAQGKIHHVGHFPELEDQMCAMMASGFIGLKSPDRVDALVWLWTEMFLGITRHDVNQRANAPKVHTRERSASRYSTRRRM